MNGASVICKVASALLILAYLFALALYLASTFGLFGAQRDPLSGIFLVPLGLPWNHFADLFPQPLWPWLGALAPVINIALLLGLCRALRYGTRK